MPRVLSSPKLQLMTTSNSAQPNQVIAPLQFFLPLPLPIAQVDEPPQSEWIEQQQQAARDRVEQRSASQHHQTDGDVHTKDTAEGGGEDVAATGGEEEEESRHQLADDFAAPAFRAPTHVDGRDEELIMQDGAIHQEEKTETTRAATSSSSSSAAASSTSSSTPSATPSATPPSTSFFLSNPYGSTFLSFSSSQPIPSTSSSSLSASQLHTGTQLSSPPYTSQQLSLTPPSDSTSNSNSVTRMSLEPHVSGLAASKMAFHSSTSATSKSASQKVLPPLPSRSIAQAAQNIEKQRQQRLFYRHGAASGNLLQPKSATKPPVPPLLNGTPQPHAQPQQQQIAPFLVATNEKAKQASSPSKPAEAKQSTIDFPQQKKAASINSTQSAAATSASSTLTRTQAGIINAAQAPPRQQHQPQQKTTMAASAPKNFLNMSQIMSMSQPAATSTSSASSTSSSSKQSHVAIRSGQLAKSRAPRMSASTMQADRLERYRSLYGNLIQVNVTKEYISSLSRTTDLVPILACNKVMFSKIRKEGCVDEVWKLIVEKRLLHPNMITLATKRQRPHNSGMIISCTQPSEWPGEVEEEEEDDEQHDQRRIAFTQPTEEYEQPKKRAKRGENDDFLGAPTSAMQTQQLEEQKQQQQPQQVITHLSVGPGFRSGPTSPFFPTPAQQPQQQQQQATPATFSFAPFQSISTCATSSTLSDFHTRSNSSNAQLAPLPSWFAGPSSLTRAPRYTRLLHVVSSFQLRVGIELVVVVQEYLRFKSIHRFGMETLNEFHLPTSASNASVKTNLLDICRTTQTGMIRAKLVSFVPILPDDHQAQLSRRKNVNEWNSYYREEPPTPWCLLTLRVEGEVGQPAPPRPIFFTLYYLDQHWQPANEIRRATLTSFQVDATTGERHLSTKNSAHYLIEAELYDATLQQNWKVQQNICMKMIRQTETEGNRNHLHREMVDRVGRIIAIKVAAVESKQLEYFSRSSYQCLQILWLTPMEDKNGYVTDLSNQDLSLVSPWDIYALSEESISLHAWMPKVQLNPAETDSLQVAISRALHDIHDLVWSTLHLRDSITDSTHNFYAHLMPTPVRAFIRVRDEFVTILSNHVLGLYTHWSLFVASMRHVVDQLIVIMNQHADTSELAASDEFIPSMIRIGEEQLPPLSPLAIDRLQSTESLLQRAADDAQHATLWREEYPHAIYKVCAAFITYINQRVAEEPRTECRIEQLKISSYGSAGNPRGNSSQNGVH